MNKLILIKFLFFALIIISSCSRKPAIIVDRADFFYNKANSYRYSNSHTSYTNNKDFYIKVKNGDTLSQIAQFYNMSSDKIANANNLKAPYQLKIGSKLKIPKNILTRSVKVIPYLKSQNYIILNYLAWQKLIILTNHIY